MKKRFTEEQIIGFLKEAEAGLPLKEQCVHRHRFETLQHASRAVGYWIRFYNHRRPHQALKMKTPAHAYALAA